MRLMPVGGTSSRLSPRERARLTGRGAWPASAGGRLPVVRPGLSAILLVNNATRQSFWDPASGPTPTLAAGGDVQKNQPVLWRSALHPCGVIVVLLIVLSGACNTGSAPADLGDSRAYDHTASGGA